MTTVVNNPSDGSNGSGMFVGIALLVIVLLAFFFFGMPALRGSATPAPGATQNNTQEMPKVPSEIDVNITTPPVQQ